MSKILTRIFRVRWGELDSSGTVSPANNLRYLIETAWDWGAAVGWGLDYTLLGHKLRLFTLREARFVTGA